MSVYRLLSHPTASQLEDLEKMEAENLGVSLEGYRVMKSQRKIHAQALKDYIAGRLTWSGLRDLLRVQAAQYAKEQHDALMSLAERYLSGTLTKADYDAAKAYYQRHPTSELSWEAFLADPRTKVNDQIYGRCKQWLIDVEKAFRKLETLNESESQRSVVILGSLGNLFDKPGFVMALHQQYGVYYDLEFALSQKIITLKEAQNAAALYTAENSDQGPLPGETGYIAKQPLTNPLWQGQTQQGSASPQSLPGALKGTGKEFGNYQLDIEDGNGDGDGDGEDHDCPSGYHWSEPAQTCVKDAEVCDPGYHWSLIEQKCVPDTGPSETSIVALLLIAAVIVVALA